MSKQNRAKTLNGYGDIGAFDRSRPRLLPSVSSYIKYQHYSELDLQSGRQNRKLRHVQGISLRNLTLAQHPPRSRGKTIDDESLPNALKTPAKALALRESRSLEHSRSSSDIKSAGLANGALFMEKKAGSALDDSENPNLRPEATKLRRRSTLNWETALPEARQKTLEDVVAGKLADVFFSLHCDDMDEPIYVSEVTERTMNPTFRFFDTNIYSAWVTRRDETTVKVWARTKGSDGYHLLLELKQHLGSLQYVGKELEGFHHPFPSNCILFHMMDGIYTSFTDLPVSRYDTPKRTASPAAHSKQKTSSFDALMRLSNLDDCIQDALSTQRTLTSQINALIAEYSPARRAIDKATRAASFLSTTKVHLASARRSLSTSENRLANLKSSLRARRAAISGGLANHDRQAGQLASARSELTSQRAQHRECRMAHARQTARVVNELFKIYPINPLDSSALHPLTFTIRSLRLPSSHHLETLDDDHLAAALGHTSSLTHLLSQYLRLALPYPLSPQGSTSTVLDPISITLGEPHGEENPRRRFPLYRKGTVAYRFEYGVFLLGKDVEWLVGKNGGRLVDLREITGNLSMLGAIIAAAADEGGKGKDRQQKKVGGHVLDGAGDEDMFIN